MVHEKKIFAFLYLSLLLFSAQGCGKNATDALLDEMEAITKQKTVLEAKLKANSPGALKELNKLREKAQSFEEKIDAAKAKGFSKAQEERFLKILSESMK
jgi:flagellar biosynthesis/type III secretory pathway protein FliH